MSTVIPLQKKRESIKIMCGPTCKVVAAYVEIVNILCLFSTLATNCNLKVVHE